MKRRSLAITRLGERGLGDHDWSRQGRFPLLEVGFARVRPGQNCFSGSCRRPVRSTHRRRHDDDVRPRARDATRRDVRCADVRHAPARGDETDALCRVDDHGRRDDGRRHYDSDAPRKRCQRGPQIGRARAPAPKSRRWAQRKVRAATLDAKHSERPSRRWFRSDRLETSSRPSRRPPYRRSPYGKIFDFALRLSNARCFARAFRRAIPSHDRPHCALNRSTPYLIGTAAVLRVVPEIKP